MKHLGDITKISGHTAPIVDCIIGGSPCQDLSVAGKRAGLDGERSGLYMEQIRIVKEMRERDERNGRADVDIRPRYMVWENVPGAFSSNKGDDFRIVLEEIAKVKDKNAVIPLPDGGKWTNYGCILGDGWSVAWRVLDAQFWGVPQRRRRIALVADFGGHSAPEILFIRKSVSGDIDEGKPKRKEASSDVTGGFGADDRLGAYQYNAVILGDTVSTLGVNCGMSHGRQCVLEPCDDNKTAKAYGISSYNSNAMKSDNPYSGIYEADTSRTLDLNGGNPSCNQGGIAIVESVQYTLKIRSGCEGGGKGALVQQDKSATLATNNDQYLFQPVIALDRAAYNQGKNAQYDFEISDKGVSSPIVARGPSAVCYGINGDKAGTLDSSYYKGCGMRSGVEREIILQPVAVADQPTKCYWDGGQVAGTLTANNAGGCQRMPDKENFNCVIQGGITSVSVDCRNGTENAVNGALQSNAAHSLNGNNVVRTRYIVRRLTPLECERLQGYPDGWTQIGEVVGYDRQVDEITGGEYVQAIYEYIDENGKKKKTSDAARYKALGNSIALPPWKWVLKRLCACYERDATMASLFDGIGGFPYLWEQLNGKGTCLWASEIEEFPMAVTKVRIGE